MRIIEQIKLGFLSNPLTTIFRLILYPFMFVLFSLCALTIGIGVAIFNLNIKAGLDAFFEIMDLSF